MDSGSLRLSNSPRPGHQSIAGANAGVPVLFPPLHEQNGDFFWWGHDHSSGQALCGRQQTWVGMWQDMVLYMTEKKGLHNLPFVFGTN